jgi:hypothetical protein
VCDFLTLSSIKKPLWMVVMPFRFRGYAQRIARRRIFRLILWSGSHHCTTDCFLDHLFYEQKMTSQVFARRAMSLLAFCKSNQQSYPQADEVLDPDLWVFGEQHQVAWGQRCGEVQQKRSQNLIH